MTRNEYRSRPEKAPLEQDSIASLMPLSRAPGEGVGSPRSVPEFSEGSLPVTRLNRISSRARLWAPVFAASALFAGGTTVAGATQSGTGISVALDWYPNANHAGLFLATERDLFANAGLDVDIYTPADPTTVLQTVGAGRDTFGISYQTDVLLARAQGVPVVSVAALVQHPLLGIMSLTNSDITRPADLVGKAVGYPGIPSQEAFLATMLEADGAALDDVELVNIGFDLVPALLSERVAAVMGAYWTHETILAEQEGYPVSLMRVEAWNVPDYYELVLVASEETVAEQPEMVETFLATVRQGYQAAIADPAAALEALAAASPDLDLAVETAGLDLLIPVWTDGVAVFGTQEAERWNAYATWMQDRDLIPDSLDVDAAWTGAFIPTGEATPVASPVATPKA
jgi:putative hydroxymethylpyrimidine transport system substrate-binding protein